jgi:hypothetical protein
MVRDDRIIAPVSVLQPDPIAESAGKMSQMAGAGGPQSAKNDFFLFITHVLDSKYEDIDKAHDHAKDPPDESCHDQKKEDDKPVRPDPFIFLGCFF